ncbi:MAG: DUF3857 domain-containing protein [Acidobacteria bacterium]|nr:DUF3857 domain-containing protein [Acidobacteriota bacterium]
MNAPRPSGRMFLCLVVCLLALAASSPSAHAFGDNWKEWRPVDPAQLALKEPVVEKDADAEALFWEVRVADVDEGGSPRTVLDHYIRIKVFTERGREAQSKVDIFAPKFGNREIKIMDVAGRTIKPDGSIVELKKEDVYERTVIKTSGLKVKAKSFALPGVEPGSIIEYRWREVRGNSFSNYDRLEFSRDIPVQRVKYYIKPSSNPYLAAARIGMRVQFFRVEGAPFQKEKDGFYSVTETNMPAYHEEPNSPPEYSARPWMLVYYSEDKKLSAQEFWKNYGKETYEKSKSGMKASDDVKRKAAEIIGDATTPEQKLERLFEFCRTQIKNVYDDANGMTAEQRAKAKDNKTPSDTLKRGLGTGYDIDMLFAALASAAGFESRVARLADRSDTFFDPDFPDDYFIGAYDIAVRVGEEWRFFDPASTYVPYGMLRWQEEGQSALLSDPKEPVFVKTPMSGPEKSLEKRTGKFKLDEEGTLEGDVHIEYTGHLAASMKETYDDDSTAEREEALKNKFKSRMGGVEITDIRIENVTDPVKPFAYNFHIRVPAYAQRTGKRLFLQPAFFQHGGSAFFTTSDRKNAIYFYYPWSEEDRVEVALPEGFSLDNAESPAPFASDKLSRYEPHLLITKDGHTLIYTRKFFFDPRNNGGFVIFPTTTYPQLKAFFDLLHKQDNHTVSLKQGASAPTAKSSTPN